MNQDLKENQLMNFVEYVEWAFNQNIDTIRSQKQQTPNLDGSIEMSPSKLSFTSTSNIRDRDMNHIVWLFRKCLTQKQADGQQEIFLKYSFIARHIFLFIMILIEDKNAIIVDIVYLMKSIGIIERNDELSFFFEENSKLVGKLRQIKYSRETIINLDKVSVNTFKRLLILWQTLKESDQQLKIENNLQIDLQQLAIINYQLNLDQVKKLKEQKKILQNSKIQIQKEKQLLRLTQSKLYSIKEVKIKGIHKINLRQQKKLILQPNGNIIIGQFWQQNGSALSLSYSNIISYLPKSNSQLNESLNNYYGFSKYEGSLNFYLQPDTQLAPNEGILSTCDPLTEQYKYKGAFKKGYFQGQGRIYINSGLQYIGSFGNGVKHGIGYQFYQGEYYIKGVFQQNQKQGKFQLCKCIEISGKRDWENQNQIFCFRNDQQIGQEKGTIQQFEKFEVENCRIMINILEIGLNNYQLNSLRPGGWINSSIIDIYLSQIRLLREKIINATKASQILYINCSDFQDIFGSILTQTTEINFDHFSKLVSEKYNAGLTKSGLKRYQITRIVFYFNLDRGHFLTVVFENNTLYLLDSMVDSRKDLFRTLKNLLMKENYQVADKWGTLDQSQQQNSYDCGIYTIYFTSQLIKYEHLSILEMKDKKYFKVEQSTINETRYNLYQILMSNHCSLLKI